jgi:Right handed beta helix region
MKKINSIFFLLFSIAISNQVFSQKTLRESFNYPSGSLLGQGATTDGWSGTWTERTYTNSGGILNAIEGNFDNDIGKTGELKQNSGYPGSSTTVRVSRDFASDFYFVDDTPEQEIWISFYFKNEINSALANSQSYIQLSDPGYFSCPPIGSLPLSTTTPGTLGMNQSPGIAGTLETDLTYILVKFVLDGAGVTNGDKAYMWVNYAGISAPDISTAQSFRTFTIGSASRIAEISRLNLFTYKNRVAYFDKIRISNIFAPKGSSINDFGTFTPDLNDSSTIATNNATLNGAIVTLGEAGGGTLLLPEGTFYIGPNPALSDRAITIGYNNITICGAGVGKTILKTNGTWSVAEQRRGHGIVIEGTTTINNPRKNIVLKDFELDGQSGWTGYYNWPADAATGDGWDIKHKGIIPSLNNYTDNVILENMYVHHYKGEILYCGGYGMGKLTVRNVKMAETNGSDFNLYGADLLVENCEFSGPSRFWIEFSPRKSQNVNQANQAIFRNNIFNDAKISTAGIVLTQGDYSSYAITFDSNTISNGKGVFGMYGGIGGPINIVNNNISNCTGKILETAFTSGWINSKNNKNVTMENNTIINGSHLAYFAGVAENFVIRNNIYTGGTSSIIYASGPLVGNLVEGNTFTNSRTVEEEWGWAFSGMRPLFRNNAYVNCEARTGQGKYFITSSAPLITPHCEIVFVYGNTANITAKLATNGYPDGQKIAISGGSATNPVKFATGQGSYILNTNKYLTGLNTLHFTFDSLQAKWIED